MDKSKLTAALVGGAIAALISGSLTYLNTKESIEMQVVFDQKAISYAQYLDSRALRNQLKKLPDYKTDAEYLSATATENAAKYKITVFSDASVVNAFSKSYSSDSKKELEDANVIFFNAMRISLGGAAIDEKTLLELLYPNRNDKSTN